MQGWHMCLFVPVKTCSKYAKTVAIGQHSSSESVRVVPCCAYENFDDCPQVPEKIWRPRRDLNPCYRRESGMAKRNSNELQERGRTGWRPRSSKKHLIVSPMCPRTFDALKHFPAYLIPQDQYPRNMPILARSARFFSVRAGEEPNHFSRI